MAATTTTRIPNYPTLHATAAKTLADARKALDTALSNVIVNPGLQALALDRDPAGWANVLRRIAATVETIPTLRADVEYAQAGFDALNKIACYKCHGTGEYNAPTSAFRNGKAYCFQCNGAGHGKH